MSFRANFIIIDKNKKYEIYDGKFAGSCVYSYLNCDTKFGTTNLLEIIKEQYDRKESIHGDCQAGFLINFSNKELLFFGHSIDLPISTIKRTYLPYLREKWKGWNLYYADFGTLDFEKIIYPDYKVPKKILNPSESWEVKSVKDKLNEIKTVKNKPLIEMGEEIVITIKFENNTIKDYRTGSTSKNFLNLVQALGNVEKLVEFFDKIDPSDLPTEEYVHEGAYIDCLTKSVFYWDDYSDYHLPYLSGLKEYCEGWKINQHFNGFPYQIEQSGRKKELFYLDNELLKEIFNNYFEYDNFDINDLIKYNK